MITAFVFAVFCPHPKYGKYLRPSPSQKSIHIYLKRRRKFFYFLFLRVVFVRARPLPLPPLYYTLRWRLGLAVSYALRFSQSLCLDFSPRLFAGSSIACAQSLLSPHQIPFILTRLLKIPERFFERRRDIKLGNGWVKN